MCSAHARRCRAQCDVLVIPQLVTILPHICLSHCCACSSSSVVVVVVRFFVVVVVLILLFLVLLVLLVVVVLATQLNRWCFGIFWHSRSKKHRKFKGCRPCRRPRGEVFPFWRQETNSQTSFSKPTRNSKTPNFVPKMTQNHSQEQAPRRPERPFWNPTRKLVWLLLFLLLDCCSCCSCCIIWLLLVCHAAAAGGCWASCSCCCCAMNQPPRQETNSQTFFSRPTRNSKTPPNFVPKMTRNHSQ